MLPEINSRLQKLQANTQLYPILWDEWLGSMRSGLDSTDIYALTVFQKRNFTISVDDLVMFYFKKELIDGLIEKLQIHLPSYKLWLVKQWQYTLCSLALNQNFDNFFSTNIGRLNLHAELKNILKEFNCRALKGLMKSYSNEELTAEIYFDKIQRFLIAHAVQNKPYSVRKEVNRRKTKFAQII